ncbi:MAG: type II secretion system protein GspN [Desulfuromonadales bacterium GWD2_61_12]|nr:MAG: type II secretion system protein GspN [Desulfuromonadales bacterium GWD2_61_12]
MIRLKIPALFRSPAQRLRPPPTAGPTVTAGPTATLRTRLIFMAASALCLGCGLLLGFYLAFPEESLRLRLEQVVSRRTGLHLTIGALHPLFPPALEATNLRLVLPGSAAAPPLTLERLRLRPLWTSLASSNPGSAFAAEFLGGSVDGSWLRRGEVTLAGRGHKLLLPLPRTPSLVFSGSVREVTFAGAFPPQPGSETLLQLTIDDCAINGLHSAGLGSDRLPLGTLTAMARGRGNDLRVERLAVSGGTLLLEGKGLVLLAAAPLQSRLNLTLTLRPGPGLDPALAGLLPLLAQPAADGSRNLAVSGTLANPALR